MKLDRFFQLFIVKEKKFYPLYISQAENIAEASKLLKVLIEETAPEKQKNLYREIKGLETKGDRITATIYYELNKTFVTPFDREDINALASRVDSFLDFIHDAARKLLMYQPKSKYKDLNMIVDHIIRDADLVLEIMKNLECLTKKSSYLLDLCQKIKEIENIVDEIYEDFSTHLFETEKDAIELVKNKNIVQSLEDATDRAKDISDTIRSIIVKLA